MRRGLTIFIVFTALMAAAPFAADNYVVRLCTFPGVVVHEWAHAQFCERLGVPVYEVVYFQLRDPPRKLTPLPLEISRAFVLANGALITSG